jgi:hypothetical protein
VSGLGALIPWAIFGLWVAYVHRTVPEAHNQYPKGSRWHWLQKHVGGKRGVMMIGGILAMSFVIGLLFVPT